MAAANKPRFTAADKNRAFVAIWEAAWASAFTAKKFGGTGEVRTEIVRLLQVETNGIGLSYSTIAKMVREKVPGAKTSPRSVACYKQYARKLTHGITAKQRDAILAITARV